MIDYNTITEKEIIILLNDKLKKNNDYDFCQYSSINDIKNIKNNIGKIIKFIKILNEYSNNYDIEYYSYKYGYFEIKLENILNIIYLHYAFEYGKNFECEFFYNKCVFRIANRIGYNNEKMELVNKKININKIYFHNIYLN